MWKSEGKFYFTNQYILAKRDQTLKFIPWFAWNNQNLWGLFPITKKSYRDNWTATKKTLSVCYNNVCKSCSFFPFQIRFYSFQEKLT